MYCYAALPSYNDLTKFANLMKITIHSTKKESWISTYLFYLIIRLFSRYISFMNQFRGDNHQST